MDIERLKKWFAAEKRDLPWRQTSDPYSIWISEIMLQQTQVAVVIPYYLNWMERFPTIEDLARASLDEVIKAWEGLGYYSRARNLHIGAKTVLQQFKGRLPDNENDLKEIKGLGPYTIGAILSFAFHKKKAAVDGNVLRVLTRYFGLKDDIAKAATINLLRKLAEEILPDAEPWVVNEALIELGATVCKKKAHCKSCPLQNSCVSFREGLEERLPFNSKKIKVERLYRSVAVIRCANVFLVKRGAKGAVMSDLYEFPQFQINEGEFSLMEMRDQIERSLSLEVVEEKILPEVTHGFTRYLVKLYPALFICRDMKEIDGLEWLSEASLEKLAFSSGHRRIYREVNALRI